MTRFRLAFLIMSSLLLTPCAALAAAGCRKGACVGREGPPGGVLAGLHGLHGACIWPYWDNVAGPGAAPGGTRKKR